MISRFPDMWLLDRPLGKGRSAGGLRILWHRVLAPEVRSSLYNETPGTRGIIDVRTSIIIKGLSDLMLAHSVIGIMWEVWNIENSAPGIISVTWMKKLRFESRMMTCLVTFAFTAGNCLLHILFEETGQIFSPKILVLSYNEIPGTTGCATFLPMPLKRKATDDVRSLGYTSSTVKVRYHPFIWLIL